jgi:integrase
MRERRPGVWEIRVAAGSDGVSGRTLQRSVTFRGSASDAERYRQELAAEYTARRSVTRAAPMLTVAELLERWLLADHPWKPSTQVGYASNARLIVDDRKLASTRVVSLTPQAVRAAFARWEAAGATSSTVALRFRVLRSAIGWAYDERIIDHHPIRSMRGPRRPEPRRPLTDDEIRVLLAFAEQRVLEAVANNANSYSRHLAEQDLLMVRLAADSGARRGELVALRFDDLDGRVLHIRRAASADVITTPKSGHPRTLTLGSATARLWSTLEQDWHRRSVESLGPWVFSPDVTHSRRLTNAALGHRFERLRNNAGVPGATLHRLRHNVATFLVARGEILQAQARLGHADASTTLREYAYALPLTDQNVADAIDGHLDRLTAEDTRPYPGSSPSGDAVFRADT